MTDKIHSDVAYEYCNDNDTEGSTVVLVSTAAVRQGLVMAIIRNHSHTAMPVINEGRIRRLRH